MQFDSEGDDDQQTVKKELKAICRDFDITVETVAERNTTLHEGLFVDPWQTDSETESEVSDDDEDEDSLR